MAARSCSTCGSKETIARFENERLAITHDGQNGTIDGMSGWRCKNCGEVVFDPESAERYGAAGDAMVLQPRST
jgi:HTH-type transcriptional regulator/antitoxin MqsA